MPLAQPRTLCVSFAVVTHAPLPTAPAERFARVIDGLCRAVAEGGGRGGLAGPLVILIWSRLRGLAVRFTALAARIQAGRHRRVFSRRRPRPAPRRPSRRALPQSNAWLLRLVPQASASGSQLQQLLADPEFAALADAAPQMRRLLRPVCRMLGVRAPPPRPPDPPRRPPINFPPGRTSKVAAPRASDLALAWKGEATARAGNTGRGTG